MRNELYLGLCKQFELTHDYLWLVVFILFVGNEVGSLKCNMSLFQTVEWWSTSVGEVEEFDHGCLCVANIDNEVNGFGNCLICYILMLLQLGLL